MSVFQCLKTVASYILSTYISVYVERGIIQCLLLHQGWSQEYLPLFFELRVSLHLFANLLIQS